MTSQRLSAALALEIATARATTRADRRATLDCEDGLGEQDMGRVTDRSRTAGEARDPCGGTNGEALHADVRSYAADWRAVSAVEHLRAQSRDGRLGV